MRHGRKDDEEEKKKMNHQVLKKIYIEFLLIADKYGLDGAEYLDLMLAFIIIALGDDFDEEDARVFCKKIYSCLASEIDIREKKAQ
jgi:hypothetical protein